MLSGRWRCSTGAWVRGWAQVPGLHATLAVRDTCVCGRGAWGRGRTVRRKRPDLDDEDVAALEEPPLGKRRRRGDSPSLHGPVRVASSARMAADHAGYCGRDHYCCEHCQHADCVAEAWILGLLRLCCCLVRYAPMCRGHVWVFKQAERTWLTPRLLQRSRQRLAWMETCCGRRRLMWRLLCMPCTTRTPPSMLCS